MIAVNLTNQINRPVEEVWNYLAEPANATSWMTGVIEAGPISEGPIGVGTKFRKVQRFLGWRTEMIYEAVEYEPNRTLTYKTVYGPLSYRGSITVESVETGTTLVYAGRGELAGLFKLAEPIFGRIAARQFRNDFNTLRKLLETG